jgi:hypothetical protein
MTVLVTVGRLWGAGPDIGGRALVPRKPSESMSVYSVRVGHRAHHSLPPRRDQESRLAIKGCIGGTGNARSWRSPAALGADWKM